MADAGSIDIAIAKAGIRGHDGLLTGESNHINTILSTNIL
jgi:hypothetical protein